MKPIFIIGTERSGTNLLRLMLNAHSAICVPHPPHIVKLFGPLVPHYGDLAVDGNFRRLIKDVCRMVDLHPYPWEIKPDPEQVFREARDRNLLCIYFAIYDQYLAFTGKHRWCCKSTFMIDEVGEILRYHPAARFIFMTRDGRDVAASAKSSIFNNFHVYYSTLRWQREQHLGLDWLAKLPADQIILLKYEELIADPPTTIRRLCSFLGEEFEEQMLDYHRSTEARKSGSLSISWENTSKPVLADNTEKFRSKLTQQEIFLFEAIACNELHELGYRLTHPLEQLLQRQTEMMQEDPTYQLKEFALKIRAEATHLRKDRNSGARLRKNFYMSYIRILRALTPPNA